MDLKQLDALAHRQQALPAGLNLPETYYFLQMRALYAMFAMQAISAEQAKEEKINRPANVSGLCTVASDWRAGYAYSAADSAAEGLLQPEWLSGLQAAGKSTLRLVYRGGRTGGAEG